MRNPLLQSRWRSLATRSNQKRSHNIDGAAFNLKLISTIGTILKMESNLIEYC
jgi:hypothetical protein